MRAFLERRGDSVKFVVTDVERKRGSDLLTLDFSQEDQRFTRSFSRDETNLDAALANFERVVDEMVLQHAGLSRVAWESALRTFLEGVEGRPQ